MSVCVCVCAPRCILGVVPVVNVKALIKCELKLSKVLGHCFSGRVTRCTWSNHHVKTDLIIFSFSTQSCVFKFVAVLCVSSKETGKSLKSTLLKCL